jgi:hypothetical protein
VYPLPPVNSVAHSTTLVPFPLVALWKTTSETRGRGCGRSRVCKARKVWSGWKGGGCKQEQEWESAGQGRERKVSGGRSTLIHSTTLKMLQQHFKSNC